MSADGVARAGRQHLMLGYVATKGNGTGDKLLAEVAHRLAARGIEVIGAVQINAERGAGQPCDMDLHLLAGTEVVRISQNLGPLARGCRLDPTGLEAAVGLVEAVLRRDGGEEPRLLIVNKFGMQEAEGRGFRPAIGLALSLGVPVLTSVSAGNRAAFDAFAGGIAEPLEAEVGALADWAVGQVG